MKYRAKHFKQTIFCAICTLIFCDVGLAQEIYYFSDRPRDLEVSANSESLLTFPAPAYARVCQPSGAVDLYPIENTGELDNFMVPMGMQSPGAKGLPMTGEQSPGNVGNSEPEMLARHLKLVPKKTSGAAVCAIRLTNEQVINVRFVLNQMVSKPMVEFRSILEKAKSGAVISQALGPLNLFRAFVSGGDIAFLAEDTPSESSPDATMSKHDSAQRSRSLSKSTSLGTYRLVYVGTDKDLYKAWRFEGTAEKDFAPSQGLKDVRLGELYFSAFQVRAGANANKSPNVTSRKMIKKGDEFNFFVLSRGDISPKEIMERLP